MINWSTLANWMQTVFALRQYHKYNDSDVLEWEPWERDVYVSMLLDYLEKEKQRMQKYGVKTQD